jgi:hypothetical protein
MGLSRRQFTKEFKLAAGGGSSGGVRARIKSPVQAHLV